MITPIEPTLEDGQEIQTFEYNEYKKDAILHTKVPMDLTQEVYNFCKTVRKEFNRENIPEENPRLAGDLNEEYGLDFRDNIPLLKKIQDQINHTLSLSMGKTVISHFVDRMWVNFQKPNEVNPIHDHTSTISLVWYLDVPECIRQEHLQQKSNIPVRGLIYFYSTFGSDSMTFNPKVGDMLMFGSHHAHQVYPFRSNVERVSLAMNIRNVCVYSDEYGSMIYV